MLGFIFLPQKEHNVIVCSKAAIEVYKKYNKVAVVLFDIMRAFETLPLCSPCLSFLSVRKYS